MNDEIGLFSKKRKPVPLEGVEVSADVIGRGTRVRVAQRYRNVENNPLEAVYKFPLPEGAALCGFEVEIDGRLIRGQIEEREKAFELYDQALCEGDGGYLLEEERPNLFTLSVGNLNPGSAVLVRIEYVSLLDMEDGRVRFCLPTTISPRYIPEHIDEGEGIPESERIVPDYATEVPYGLSLKVNIHGEQPASIDSPSHPIRVDIGETGVSVSFSAETVRMDRDFVLILDRGDVLSEAQVCWAPVDGDLFMQLDLSPEAVDTRSHEEKEIVFVLDCSGSMDGDSITQAKRALEICLRGLEEGTHFNVCRFGSTHRFLFKEPKPYGEKSLKQALSWCDQVDADLGGTEILAPLQAIYASGVRQETLHRTIVLLTDGEVGNEDEIIGLVRKHRATTRFFSIGIGAGPNEYFIKGLARAGRGTHEFIYPGERIEPKALRIFRGISAGLLENVAVDWGFGNVEPAPAIPVICPGTAVTLFARVPGTTTPNGPVTVSGVLSGSSFTKEIQPSPAPAHTTFLPLPLLWARERIRDLEEGEAAPGKAGSRQLRRNKEKEWKENLLNLSRMYGLVSRFSSYVALEERTEKDKSTGELVLRKVPVAVAVGWHGAGARLTGSMTTGMANIVMPCSAPVSASALGGRLYSRTVESLADCYGRSVKDTSSRGKYGRSSGCTRTPEGWGWTGSKQGSCRETRDRSEHP